MGAVKLAAHPLVVAVAMGLLAPTALAACEDDKRRRPAEVQVADWDEAPTAEDFDRAEAMWEQSRSVID